jgi:hypothetical protein
MMVFLDSGVLGILSNPTESETNAKCEDWLFRLLSKGIKVITSEICKYEVKRSLILAQKRTGYKIGGVEKLAELSDLIEFIPITKNEIDIACEIWSDSVIKGIQVAAENDINFDIIICAQWKNLTTENPGQEVVIATHNLRHLRRFAKAEEWENI